MKTLIVRELKKSFSKKELDLPVYIRTIDKDGEEKMFTIQGTIVWNGKFLEISSGDELEQTEDGFLL